MTDLKHIASRVRLADAMDRWTETIAKGVAMQRTPEEPSDETIERLCLNAETVLGNHPVGYVIDLRRKYAFQLRMIGTFRRPQYECIDMLTYDPDPDGAWHLIGYGATEGEAQGDLLEKIAYQVAHE